MRNLSAAFDNFIEIMKSTINAHAPLKIAFRRHYKLLSKAWLTKGIQISICNKKKFLQLFYKGGNAEQKSYYKNMLKSLQKEKNY